jgi:uncharacterized membrane protein
MQFIKTTIIGGLIFLIPVVIVVAVVGKALEIMMLVAKPLDALVPVDSIGGIAMVNVLALLAIALCCFIAGVIARSALAKKGYRALDTALLAMPGYAFVKGFTDSMGSSEEAAKSFLPVIVQFDDNAQIGFEVERKGGGKVVVYLPGAPNPWSGSVAYFSEDRVKQLNMTVAQAISNIRQLGRGSTQYSELT